MTSRNPLSPLDHLLVQFDQALRTLVPGSSQPARPSPAEVLEDASLADSERRHAAALMRINHTGEVCAQALYQGQALTARLPEVRSTMEQAASEEVDHLAWCEQRLQELDSRTSLLNPLWYAMSFSVGAVAGLAGDRWSLGFVAETEQQVCDHLQDQLGKLPDQDARSRAIVTRMMEDERQHGEAAREAGGAPLPAPVKLLMGGLAAVMKQTVYRI
ncbi:MAG: hypothetical protein RLZZ385_1563 [Pseudomonadota bacterium]|jgi:ubiquinone biosynthesis monooxygenase Coq7